MRVRRALAAGQAEPPSTPPTRRRWRKELRRFGRTALWNAVKGAGYAFGAGLIGLLFVWMQR